MKMGRIGFAILAGLLPLGCSAKPQESTGNTNWLTCTEDSECGGQVCLCGHCSDPCEGTLDCTRGPAEMCVADVGPEAGQSSPLPSLEQLWAYRDADVQGLALSVANDGSVWVAGGSDRTYFDLSYMFPSYWLAHFDTTNGALLWEARDPSMGATRALALSAQGRVATITTNYVEGNRTTVVERDAATGDVIASVDVLEEAGAVLYDDSDRPILGGSRLLGDVNGRPTSSLWLAALDDTLGTASELTAEGPRLGWTGVASLAQASDGTLFVGAFQGVTTESNASVPWVLGVRDGAVAWEHVYDTGTDSTGSAQFIASRPEGGALVRGMDSAGAWVRALNANGETEWTERMVVDATHGTVTPLTGGYAITDGGDSCYGCAGLEAPVTPLTVTGFSRDREPVWRVQVEDCEVAYAAATNSDGTLVVLGICGWGLGLFGYALP